MIHHRLGLFVVADGMGGHNAGEVAAALAVDTVVEFVRATAGGAEITWPFPLDVGRSMVVNRVDAALRLANLRVREAGRREPRHAGMGTTIVAVLVEGDRLVVGHVGDSRAYLLDRGVLQQMTADHTWLNTVMGESAAAMANHPMRHVLTSGIGMGVDLAPSVAEHALREGQQWLICTDGVHGAIGDSEIRAALAAPSAAEAAQELVRRALAGGTTDNATALVVNVGGSPRV